MSIGSSGPAGITPQEAPLYRRLPILLGLALVATALAWFLFTPATGDLPEPAPTRPPVAAGRPTAAKPLAAASAPRTTPAAAVPGEAPSTAQTPTLKAVRELDKQLASFVERDLAVPVPEGATRELEDRLMIERLKAHAAEAARLQKAYEDLIARHDDPRAEVLARISIGDLQEALAIDIEEGPIPSYLEEHQIEAYRDGLSAKAEAQYQAAREAWTQASERASELPPDAEIQALLLDRKPEEGGEEPEE